MLKSSKLLLNIIEQYIEREIIEKNKQTNESYTYNKTTIANLT